jgi:hypothetical protein
VATSHLRRHDDDGRCSLILIVSSDHSFDGDRCISNSDHSAAYAYSSPDLIHILFGSSVCRFASCSEGCPEGGISLFLRVGRAKVGCSWVSIFRHHGCYLIFSTLFLY